VLEAAGVEVDPGAEEEGSGGAMASNCFIIRGSNAQLCSSAERRVLTVEAIVRSSWVSKDWEVVTWEAGGMAVDWTPGCAVGGA